MENLNQNQFSDIDNIINEIIQGIHSGETAVFCGAGISRNSGLPIVNQFVPYLLEKLDLPEKDIELILNKESYPKIPFEFFIQILKDNGCNDDNIFDIYEKGKPNTNHILLAKLIKIGVIKTIVTTNFDKLIEKALAIEALEENKDYNVIYKEEDFEKINWSKDSIRIVKIHGSIDDRETMAISLNQVANKILSSQRKKIIEELFNKGRHANVLILGYSSSDVFDLSPHIETLKGDFKKVYFIQHSDDLKVEDLQVRKDKNPFKEFNGSQRIYYNTNQLIKIIWESIIDEKEPYELITSETNWKKNIDEWYNRAIKDHLETIRLIIPAHIYEETGEFGTAIKYYEQALKVAKEIDNNEWAGHCFISLGYTYLSICEYRKSLEYYKQALNFAKDIGDKLNVGASLGGLGNTSLAIGEYNEAIKYYKQALKIAKRTSNKIFEDVWLANIGLAHDQLGNFIRAIVYNKLSLKIAQEIGDIKQEGTALGNLGVTYSQLRMNKKAKQYFQSALKIAKEVGDKYSVGIWITNIGLICNDLGEYNISIEYSERALKINKEIGNKQGEGPCLYNLGNVYRKLGKYTNAIEYYEQAIIIAKELSERHGILLCLVNIGRIFNYLGDYTKAIENFERGLDILKPIVRSDHSIRIIDKSYIYIIKYCLFKTRFKSLFKYYQHYLIGKFSK